MPSTNSICDASAMSQHGTRIANPALSEEIHTINAIYGTGVATSITSTSNSSKASSPDHLVLHIPGQSISFLLSFPPDYPATSPRADGTQSTGQQGKGEGHAAVQLVQKTLEKVWTPGSVCLFDLIEEARPLLVRLQDGAGGSSGPVTATATTAEEVVLEEDDDEQARTRLTGGPTEKPRGEDATRIPDWSVSDAITERKSVFIARCARVSDTAAAAAVLAHLLATDKKVAAATHNISAWRLRGGETGVPVQDCDDDGETAAGGRLLRLMQLMEVWDVVVVVSRWYGGVRLGPDRFRLVNQVAGEALRRGGFGKLEEEGGKKRGKK